MRYFSPIIVILASLLLLSGGPATAGRQDAVISPPPSPSARDGAPPTPEQLKVLAVRTLENQHQSDLLFEQYERTEHDRVQGSGVGIKNKNVLSRIVPAGVGVERVELERDDIPTDAISRARQWQNVIQTLVTNGNTDDPKVKKAYERTDKNRRDRAELVAAVPKAFRFRYVGSENNRGRTLIEVAFEPDPSFRSSLRWASIYKHVHGTAWVDEASSQIVRLDAELFEDMGIGGGLVAKAYRGCRVTLEQREIEPGVWMPTRTTFDLAGRWFFFPATFHQQLDEADYRRIGSPQEAVQIIRREHPEPIPEPVSDHR